MYIRQNRLKSKTITRDKEVYYVMTKGSIHQEDMIIVNINALYNGAPKCIK